MRTLFEALKSHLQLKPIRPAASASGFRMRSSGTGLRATVAALGMLGGTLAYSGTSQAVEGRFRIAPQDAPHKTFDLPGVGCPYYAPNATNTLALFSYDNVCATGDQQWYIHDTGGGKHTIRQGGSGGKCLDLSNGKLGTWDCNFGPNQLWYFDYMTDPGADGLYGLFKIRSVLNNTVIDLAGDNTANSTPIGTWSDTGGTNQRWILWANGGMHKDFEDDFNGTGLDTGAWSAANFGAGTFNGELQNYSPGQVQVSNGTLHLNTNYNSGCGGGTGFGCYQSGRISSKGKRWYSNGMFSARVHYYDSGAGNMGTWPAFWLLGNNVSQDPVTAGNVGGSCWPTSGARELDIWEWEKVKGGVYGANAIQSGGCGSYNSAGQNQNIGWNTGNYVIATVKIAGDGRVKFYNGGTKVLDVSDSGFWNESMAFVFNQAVGGTLGGSSAGFNSTAQWASIEVDWVTHETN